MKTIKIIQLILLLIIIVLLAAILITGIIGNFQLPFHNMFRNIGISNSVLIYDQQFDGSGMEKVDARLSSSNIEFELSQNNNLRVVYYGPEAEKDDPAVKTVYDNNTLEIAQDNRIGFFRGIRNERVVVYLPVGFSSELYCEAASGNILLHDNMDLDSLQLTLSSGNVSVQDVSVSRMTINVSSGGIKGEKIQADSYNIKLSSGNLKIAEMSGSGDIISTSGNLRVDNYDGGGLIKSTSGSIDLGVARLTDDLEVKLTSGSVDAKLLQPDLDIICEFDVLSGRIRTNFGNVDKHTTGASFRHDLSDGAGHYFRISTTSGDIKIEQ